MNKFFLIVVSLLFVLFPVLDSHSYSKLAPVKTKFGLHQAVFQTDSGKITISLPSDMVPGETISGSLLYTGNPSQFDLIIEGKIVGLIGNNFTIDVPTSITTGVLSVVLRYLNGVEIGRAFFPTNLVKLNNLNRAASNFKLPVHGRSGVPSEILGPFDGKYENTSISLSGKKLVILAESTGKMVFLSSNSHQGAGVLNLSESGQDYEGKYTNLVVVKVGEELMVPNDAPREKEFKEIVEEETKQTVEVKEVEETVVAEEISKDLEIEEKVEEITVAEVEPEKEVKRKEVIEVIEKKSPEELVVEKDLALIEEDLEEQLNSPFYDSKTGKTEKVAEKVEKQPEETEPQEIVLVDPAFEEKEVAPSSDSGKKFCIQLASFKKKSEAEDFINRLSAEGFEGYIKEVDIPKKGKWNRIRIGGFDSREEATKFSEGIDMKKLYISSIFITEED